jgi:RNA polymerase sigma-70 factor, ECF subfamily
MAEDDLSVDGLLLAARANGEILGQLFERYRPYLKLLAKHEIGPKLAVREDASDVVQQTFTEAYQAFQKFVGSTEPEFSAWIRRIHYRNLAELVQKHVVTGKQSLHREQRLDDHEATASFCWREPAANQSSPLQHIIKGEKALRLAGLIESLPEMQREAVRLRYVEGCPVEKISQQLDRSLTATAGLLKRGLRTLRSRMSETSWA